ncbi:MAG: FISUMP domain-containing protein, partial [Bacteroidales bacterium]
ESVFNQLIEDENLIFVTGYDQDGLIFDPNDIPELNTLVNLTPGMGYWVKVVNEAVLNITGAQIQPSFTINLTTGWNLVAYWPEEPLPPEDAFGSLITAGILQIVTGYDQDGQIFDPGEPFLNTLTEIRNGYGYWVKVTADYIGFTYPQPEWSCGMPIGDERDNQNYQTVQIGTQCWMAENLNIGAMINGTTNQTNNGVIEKDCYDNLETNCDVYGGLYQWDEMMQYTTTAGAKGICPADWHLPTDEEWNLLTTYVSGQPKYLCNNNTNYIAKSLAAATNWNIYNQTCSIGNDLSVNNATGFAAMPSGLSGADGWFDDIGNSDYWWTSTEYCDTDGWSRILVISYASVLSGNYDKSLGFSVRCLKDENAPMSVPTVTTSEIREITSVSAISSGEVTLNGGAPVTERGVCWNTSQNPTIEDNFTVNGSGTGTFTSNITNLEPGTTYYVRAYATNSEGTAYGNVLIFSTPTEFLCGDNITDTRDGKVYSTVQIGTQCWMAENLNIGAYLHGSIEQSKNGIVEKYCYNNLETNCDVYGGLYLWDEVMQYSTVEGEQGICPPDWHLPSVTEWNILTDLLGGLTFAGGKMKETGMTYWFSPNTGATNSSGFTGLPGGTRYPNGLFYSLSGIGYWWSSTEYDIMYDYGRSLEYNGEHIGTGILPKGYGISVRCLNDENTQVSVPTVTTSEITTITSTSAISGGNVT